MPKKIYSSVAMVAIVAASTTLTRASEEKVQYKDLPKDVVHSLTARFPGLTITSAAKETESDGKVVFDIELKQKDRKFETDIQKDGTMLEVEKEIFEKNWSNELRSTVEAKYPKGKITEVLEVNKVTGGKEVPDHLEVNVTTADKKNAEILLSLDGKTEVHEDAAAAPAKPAAAGGDEGIKLSELPAAVVEGVKAKFPKATIKSAEKGTEGGKPIFEVTIEDNKHSTDVTLSPTGEILSYEKTLAMNELPKGMKKAINAKYPGSMIHTIEEVFENGKITGYEGVIVTADKKKVELDFDPKGKLVESTK